MAEPAHNEFAPGARVDHVDILELSRDRATLDVAVELTNPLPDPISIGEVTYTLTADHAAILNGYCEGAGRVKGLGSFELSVPIDVESAAVLAACPRAETGSIVACRVYLTITVQTQSGASHVLAVDCPVDLPLAAGPDIVLSRIAFTELGWSRTEATLELAVTNRCPFDVDLVALELRLAVNGTAVITHRAPTGVALAAAGQRQVRIPITFSPANVGYATFQLLQQPTVEYHLCTVAHCLTPYGPMSCKADHDDEAILANSAAPPFRDATDA